MAQLSIGHKELLTETVQALPQSSIDAGYRRIFCPPGDVKRFDGKEQTSPWIALQHGLRFPHQRF
jgi:hypothetical protein